MPRGVRASVTPGMLRWARELAGCSLEEAGRFVGKDAGVVAAWESDGSGELPTVRQGEKLARAYRVSYALFYLDGPTADLEFAAVADFRRDAGGRPWSRQLRWMVRQAQERQAFAVELLRDYGGAEQGWVGSASLGEDPEAVGGRIREALGVGDDGLGLGFGDGNTERVLAGWVERVEGLGAFVSRYLSGGSRYWGVDPLEARGFSLCDGLAPYIVLNGRDAPGRMTFMLMHGLAHLYYGQGGLDDLGDAGLAPGDDGLLELRCNQAAAAALMPSVRFRREWGDAVGGVNDRVGRVADVFGVGRLAAAVRAGSEVMGFISAGEFDGMRGWVDAEGKGYKESRSGGGGGISEAVRALKELGGRYVGLVFDVYAEGGMSRLDAADALGVRIGDVDGVRDRLRV